MKKTILATLGILMIGLTACGTSTTQAQPDIVNAELPIQVQILIGSFKLENTDQAITAKQAADLLPLWQVYKDMSSSDNAAQPEIDALVEQIQETMTPEQIEAIQDMKLTRQDMFALMQEQGLVSAPAAGQTGNFNGSGSNPPLPGGGGFPGGAPPGGGAGGPNGGQNLTPEQIATAQARRSQGGGGGFANQIPPALFDALIKFLENK